MGAAGYFHRHIKDHSKITAPLSDLTKKNAKFVWKPEHERALVSLKEALVTAPLLKRPNFDLLFEIHTDASQ